MSIAHQGDIFAAKKAYEKSLEVEDEKFIGEKKPIDWAGACFIVEDALRLKHEHILREGDFSPEAFEEAGKLWAAFTKVRDG